VYQPIVESITVRLQNTAAWLQGKPAPQEPPDGKQALRILNERINTLMDQRKAELDRSVTADSDTRLQLSEFKPIVDQFNFIAKVTAEIERLGRELNPVSTIISASPASPAVL
jgi:hypothetical protein